MTTHGFHRVLHDVAAAATFEAPDLERIVLLGRIRARRMALAGLTLALTLTASVLAVQDDDRDGTDQPEPPADQSPNR